MGARPRVSIIIPLYNLCRFVAETIDSALAQTLDADATEIVVIDDGSTDGGGNIVRRYAPRVQYVRQENRGLPAARNAGIRASQAPFVTFLDADDRILPEKLEAQLTAFESRPDVGLVYTGWHYIDESGGRLPQRGRSLHEGDVFPELILGNLIHPHTAVVRRELVERVAGFDETLTSVEDWDLWLRLSQIGVRWHCVDRPLAEYRIRHDGMHQNAARMLENRLRVLEKIFADPTLPAAVVHRRAAAYQNAYLIAACDFFRMGNWAEGSRWFHAAVTTRPAFVTEQDSLRRFCRLILPQGHQREAAVVTHWRPLARMLRRALRDLYAQPDLDPALRALRRRATIASWRTVLRLARKGAAAAFRAEPVPRIALPLPPPRAKPEAALTGRRS